MGTGHASGALRWALGGWADVARVRRSSWAIFPVRVAGKIDRQRPELLVSPTTILVLSVDEADRLTACPPRRGLAATTGDVLRLNAGCAFASGFLVPARRALAHDGIGSVAPTLLRATGMREEDRLAQLDTAGMAIDRRRKNGLVGHGNPANESSATSCSPSVTCGLLMLAETRVPLACSGAGRPGVAHALLPARRVRRRSAGWPAARRRRRQLRARAARPPFGLLPPRWSAR